MNQDDFLKLVKEGWNALPKKFLKKINNVALVVENWPTPLQLKKVKNPYGLLLGLYEGVPQTQRGFYNQALPDRITIFQQPIELLANNDPEKIKQIVFHTIWHEVAHHFGFDEDGVKKAEKKKSLKINN